MDMDYNIRLEYQLAPTEENGQALVEALESFSPAAGPNDNGNLDVWITVPANNARQAIDTGLALSRTAAAAELIGFEAITTEEFDRREWVTPLPDLIGSEEAASILGISRQAVGQKFTAGQLPGARIGERTIVFARRDIEAAARRRSGGRFELRNETETSAEVWEPFFSRVVAVLDKGQDGMWSTSLRFVWLDSGTQAVFAPQPTMDAAYDALVAWGGDHFRG
jgi:hypothetical protein